MFDFEKAINGEPIYCNGQQVYTTFSITEQTFYIDGAFAFRGICGKWDKNGNHIYGKVYTHPITTTPPKKKVKVTAYVYTDDNGQIAFAREKILREWKFLGEITGEVEI